MTEKEHIELVAAGDAFCRDLAAITAKALKKFNPAIRDEVIAYLQDKASLYSPFTSDVIEELMKDSRI